MMRRSAHQALTGAMLVLSACTGSISGSAPREGEGTPGQEGGPAASRPASGGAGSGVIPGPGPGVPAPGGAGALAPVALRRLTLSQYRNTIEDLFGAGVKLSP